MKLDTTTKKLIQLALKEDIGKGDITTALSIPKEKRCRGKIIFREAGVVAGLALLGPLFKRLDRRVNVRTLVKEGKRVRKNRVVATIEGPARSILTGERVALNFLSHLSGVATLTDRYLKKIRPYHTKLLTTRKTTPGWRALEKYAVHLAGGKVHRMGLYDAALIKENHLALRSKGKNRKPERLREWIRKIRSKAPKNLTIEIEAQSLREFRELIVSQADIILLDNLSVPEIRKAVRIRNKKGKKPLLGVSGGVTLQNIRKIAKTGVERISVGRLTHSAPAVDISVDIDRIR